ncbi:MAG: hypothetical protein U1E51_00670 [Candidatus Binatia bacterium]|nr:hypothetical protein [Candidatus Binatia bacterium]
METPEQEATRVRAEVAQEMADEESGETLVVERTAIERDPETSEDPWAGVNPALKSMFNEMSERVVTLSATEQRLKQAESRIGSISNELHVAKTAVAAAQDAPTAEQIAEAAESDEKWETLQTDFPEWADAIDARLDRKLAVKLTELKKEIKEIGGGNTTAEGTAEEVQKGILSYFKPKWQATINSKEWKEWLAMQPEETIALVNSPQATDAVTLIDAFEEAQPQKTATEIAAERKRRIKTSILPQGGKATPVKSEADMSASELRANIGKEVYAE